jgi:hypothetical protein
MFIDSSKNMFQIRLREAEAEIRRAEENELKIKTLQSKM